MLPYIPNALEEEKMLKSMGIGCLDDLFSDIPEEIRLKRKLNIEKTMSEIELSKYMKELSNKNKSIDELVCFLGAGAYDHYMPAVVKHITSKPEFYTAYTPYQAEISQGTLQSIFEYQTMICNLTDMDVSNASLYDGGTAVAEAAILAVNEKKNKNSIVVSKTVHPETRKILKTYMKFKEVEVIEVDFLQGITDIDKLKKVVDKNTAGVIVQNPNFFGIIEDLSEVQKITHKNNSLLITSVDPISLGILKTPGEIGADIAVGEGQGLGNSLCCGGPYIGFMAVTSKLMRKIPGRIVGETEDIEGKRGFVLTLQTREQHIRREKAASNICSNQALNALAVAVYLSTMGKEGIREVAKRCYDKAHYAFKEIMKNENFQPLYNKPFFKEFTVESKIDVNRINKQLLKKGILGGYTLEKDYPNTNSLLLCVTEKRTKEEIDTLVRIMREV